MLDIFPSVDTTTSLNNYVREAISANNNSEAEAEEALQEIEESEQLQDEERQEKELGENIDVHM